MFADDQVNPSKIKNYPQLVTQLLYNVTKTKLQANYTDRAVAACWRS
jgi:hypothetical protein